MDAVLVTFASRFAAIKTILGIILMVAAFAYALGENASTGGAASKCGVNRWDVKTLSDPASKKVSFTAKDVTPRFLVHDIKKSDYPKIGKFTPRQKPVEFRTFRVRAQLIEAGREDDSDIHLVIADHFDGQGKPVDRMIVEFPAAECLDRLQHVQRESSIKGARKTFDSKAVCGQTSSSFHALQGQAEITGVAFLDITHGTKPTGQAPNGIELHPVLRFRYLGPGPCRPSR
jgi:hypothetical protein